MFKRLTLCSLLIALCLSLAVPSIAMAIDTAIVNQANTAELLPIERSTSKELNIVEIKAIVPADIEIFDYGSLDSKQNYFNKIEYRESSALIDNFAKVQNFNFERMSYSIKL